MRVVSLLPSATEIVACVGGALVGRSHECNYPAEVWALPALTAARTAFEDSRQMNDAVTETLRSGQGLYTIDAEILRRLEPDVVVTQSLCAVCSVDYATVTRIAETLPKRPVVVDLNPQSLEEVLDGVRTVGAALRREEAAQEVVLELTARVDEVLTFVATLPATPRPSWVDPIFVGGHWTPQLIQMAGATHPLNPPQGSRGAKASYAISNEAFAKSDPDWIIICPCGLDIAETEKEMQPIGKAAWWCQLRAVTEGRVVVVDGDQMFNRPGPRLVDALEWLVSILHNQPALAPASFPWKFFPRSK